MDYPSEAIESLDSDFRLNSQGKDVNDHIDAVLEWADWARMELLFLRHSLSERTATEGQQEEDE
tara:strand:+ start:2908 stop:3099 length:192 start_codon:yes stop_codon:yes gene_type:complete